MTAGIRIDALYRGSTELVELAMAVGLGLEEAQKRIVALEDELVASRYRVAMVEAERDRLNARVQELAKEKAVPSARIKELEGLVSELRSDLSSAERMLQSKIPRIDLMDLDLRPSSTAPPGPNGGLAPFVKPQVVGAEEPDPPGSSTPTTLAASPELSSLGAGDTPLRTATQEELDLALRTLFLPTRDGQVERTLANAAIETWLREQRGATTSTNAIGFAIRRVFPKVREVRPSSKEGGPRPRVLRGLSWLGSFERLYSVRGGPAPTPNLRPGGPSSGPDTGEGPVRGTVDDPVEGASGAIHRRDQGGHDRTEESPQHSRATLTDGGRSDSSVPSPSRGAARPALDPDRTAWESDLQHET